MVTWREYEALRDHLKHTIEHSADTLDGDIEAVKTQLGTTETTVNTIQTQVTDIQTNMARLEVTMTRLTGMLENQQFDNAASMGDNEEADPALNLGRGRGNANRGRGFHPVGGPRVRHKAPQDDAFGRPKFTIPKFLGKDAEEFLNWEMRIESLWRLHECTDDRKIRLSVSEFDEYAMSWWDNACSIRRDNNMVPILTWRDMKADRDATSFCAAQLYTVPV